MKAGLVTTEVRRRTITDASGFEAHTWSILNTSFIPTHHRSKFQMLLHEALEMDHGSRDSAPFSAKERDIAERIIAHKDFEVVVRAPRLDKRQTSYKFYVGGCSVYLAS